MIAKCNGHEGCWLEQDQVREKYTYISCCFMRTGKGKDKNGQINEYMETASWMSHSRMRFMTCSEFNHKIQNKEKKIKKNNTFYAQPYSTSCGQAGCSFHATSCSHSHFGAEGATRWIKQVLIDKVVEGKSAPANCLSNALINQSGSGPVTGGAVSRSATGSPPATHLPAWRLLPLCQTPLSKDHGSTGHPSVRRTPAFCQTGFDRPLPPGRPQRPI